MVRFGHAVVRVHRRTDKDLMRFIAQANFYRKWIQTAHLVSCHRCGTLINLPHRTLTLLYTFHNVRRRQRSTTSTPTKTSLLYNSTFNISMTFPRVSWQCGLEKINKNQKSKRKSEIQQDPSGKKREIKKQNNLPN